MTNYDCEHSCLNYELCKALNNVPNDITAFGSCKFYKNKYRFKLVEIEEESRSFEKGVTKC